ncbi:hypothetical protein DENIS_4118 [Desulfonema ishimotonii]|uniref:Uncharacterized protein n=1 Tax=Desulfonema ishimotonii TaxID=45657 RepID=A0A401G1P9_9BACT|nr:hypothetical protein DENIS_4118 [Desulfonema ishimotonii]
MPRFWCAEVAQSVEQGTENPRVGSSILSLGTKTPAEVAQSVEQGTENPRVGSSILSLGTYEIKGLRFLP